MRESSFYDPTKSSMIKSLLCLIIEVTILQKSGPYQSSHLIGIVTSLWKNSHLLKLKMDLGYALTLPTQSHSQSSYNTRKISIKLGK